VKVTEDAASGTVKVYSSTGWPHKHDGEYKGKNGLPPTVKVVVDAKLDDEPRMKFTALWCYLEEQYHVPLSMRSKVQYYLKRHKRGLPALEMGVSTYGAAATTIENELKMDIVLSKENATIDSTGVIGYELDPEANRGVVIMSSVEMAM